MFWFISYCIINYYYKDTDDKYNYKHITSSLIVLGIILYSLFTFFYFYMYGVSTDLAYISLADAIVVTLLLLNKPKQLNSEKKDEANKIERKIKKKKNKRNKKIKKERKIT